MPFGKDGKHHLNTQKAMAADKMPPRRPDNAGKPNSGVADPMGGKDEQEVTGDSTRTILSHNDDGSHSVMHHDGEETGPHDSIEEALEMIAAKHGAGMQHASAAPHHGMPMHEGHAMMSGM